MAFNSAPIKSAPLRNVYAKMVFVKSENDKLSPVRSASVRLLPVNTDSERLVNLNVLVGSLVTA